MSLETDTKKRGFCGKNATDLTPPRCAEKVLNGRNRFAAESNKSFDFEVRRHKATTPEKNERKLLGRQLHELDCNLTNHSQTQPQPANTLPSATNPRTDTAASVDL